MARQLTNPEKPMRLQISKHGMLLYEGTYDIADADSFSKAWLDAWWKLRQQQIQNGRNIGALMEHLDRGALDQLNRAQISPNVL
jgi:hypothetical protein